VDSDVGEELEQLAPAARKGNERTEVGRILAPPREPSVALPVAMASRPGTSRWVNVMVPTFPWGISRPLPARAVSGLKALVVTPTANPALAPRK